MNKSQLRKASNWLNDKCGGRYFPMTDTRLGYAAFNAFVFKIPRERKPSVWFLATMDLDDRYESIKSIKRICNY